MKTAARLSLIAGLASVAGSAGAQALDATVERSIPASYPEGPVEIRGRMLVAEMTNDRVGEITEAGLRTFWSQSDCGPTSIAEYGRGSVVVLCHLGGYLAVVGLDGELKRKITATVTGQPINYPNDSVADDSGGVYLSDSGVFSRLAPATGKLLYLAADGTVRRLARGYKYANGVTINRATNRLYLSEHLGGRVHVFQITGPGRVRRAGIALAREEIERAVGGLDRYAGPDGLEFIDDDTFVVCIYERGVILHVSSSGMVIGKLDVDVPYVTNIGRWGKRHVITGAMTIEARPYPGVISVVTFRR